jgi:hypothetical protein
MIWKRTKDISHLEEEVVLLFKHIGSIAWRHKQWATSDEFEDKAAKTPDIKTVVVSTAKN